MKYAITGHTSGIGKELFSKLSPNSIGFSLSTGYDIRNKKDRTRLIDESADCDVFINSAPAEFGQAELLYELWREWKNFDKTIINVGSRIADDDVELGLSQLGLIGYRSHKLALKHMYLDLVKLNTPVKVKYASFAYVGIPRILQKYPEFTEKDYITIDEAIKIILNA